MNREYFSRWLDDGLHGTELKEFECQIRRDERLLQELYEQMQMDVFMGKSEEPQADLQKSITREVRAYFSQARLIRKAAVRRKTKEKRILFCAFGLAAVLLFVVLLWPVEFTLKEGETARIETAAHSLVIVGPAVYSMRAEHLKLSQGSLLAEVHSGKLSVQTPHGTFIDRGTVFEVNTSFGSSKLHVIEGEVEALSGAQSHLAGSGEALQLARGQLSEIPFDSQLFERYSSHEVISVNLGQSSLEGKAGVVMASNWNNQVKSGMRLKNHRGDDTSISLKLSGGINWHEQRVTGSNEWKALYGSLLVGARGTNSAKLTLELTEISYRKYDLYVYYRLGGEGIDQLFDLSVNGSAPFRVHRQSIEHQGFVRWQAANREKSGNYQLFSALSGETLKIELTVPEAFRGQGQWYIAGLQLVEVK